MVNAMPYPEVLPPPCFGPPAAFSCFRRFNRASKSLSGFLGACPVIARWFQLAANAQCAAGQPDDREAVGTVSRMQKFARRDREGAFVTR